MDTPPKTLCGICDAQHVTKTADFWCPECDDGLCNECHSHHSFSKASRLHGVISIEDYRKLSPDISSIVHHCIEHEKKLQIYCPHHDQLCCLLCISTSHKDCTGMLPIDEMAKTSKSSGLLETLQKSLEDLKSNIDNVVKDRQSNLTKIREQRQNILAGIQNLRKKINSHFDKMEQEIEKELNTSVCDLKTKIEDLLHGLKEKQERIAVLQSNIKDLKNHASDLQTFIGSKQLEEKIEAEETYVQSLSEDDRLKQLSLKCTHNEGILNLLQSKTSFGSISIESSSPSVVVKLEKTKQAQIMSASVIPKSVDNVRATLLRKIQIPKGKSCECNITGCAIFPNGKFIFADCDNNKRLVIFNTDGSFDCEKAISGLTPFDVACIDDTTVAFTAWECSKIYIFDIKKKSIKTTIETKNDCYGIAYQDGKIYYANAEHLGVAQLEDNCTKSIVNFGNRKSFMLYVSCFCESIYLTEYEANSVCCYSDKSNKMWEFKDKTVLKSPYGVAVDRNGIVYVAFCERNCIVAVSPDGKKAVDFLSAADGIETPYKLFFDSKRDLLLVAGYDGKCSLYQIN
ncbi:tripartite motif-containing protein 5-like [Mytilus edulis]|uniref:tripartite motif-containing protein 5-like n=1 Tax=Mytilus edulis TaxID=6550 RepID=UPI0039EF0C17